MEVIFGMKKLKRLPTRKNVLNWATGNCGAPASSCASRAGLRR